MYIKNLLFRGGYLGGSKYIIVYFFLCLFANALAAATELNPHAFSANAFLVGSPFGFFISPFMPANLAANDTRLGLTPDLTGAFKLPPVSLL
jgi:hypothetical protein